MLAWSFMQFRQTQVFVFGGSALPIHFRWYHSKHASQPIAWRLFSSLSHALQSHVFSFLTFLSSDCTVFQAPLVKCFFTRNTLTVSSRIFFGIFSTLVSSPVSSISLSSLSAPLTASFDATVPNIT